MSHYLREHLDAVGELPQKLRETMAWIGMLDERVQSISALIDTDIGEVARARQRYYAQFESIAEQDPPSRTSKAKVSCARSLLRGSGCCWQQHFSPVAHTPSVFLFERRAVRI